ncbi:acyl-CoA dehydrogenase, partial [Pseudomonas fragi]|nr:acyl-CoA dehydrogenase [Pseudomonas sp. GC01]
MNIGFSAADEHFRQQVAQWMQEHLSGQYNELRFRGGPGDEDFAPGLRKQ